MVIMASPPYPFLVAGLFLLTFGFWFISWNLNVRRRALRVSSALLFATMLVFLPAAESRHRALQTITGTPSNHLVVIGDSISAGINPLQPPWPAVMQNISGVRVVNLAQPGAYVRDGLDMADKLVPGDRLLLVEIGGNDLITGVPTREFRNFLDALLRRVCMPQRTVVMFELPLLPWRIGDGQAQRELATKYGVVLIPKRFFMYVISGPKATSDGLHLLPEGEQRMALLVLRVFKDVLYPDAVNALPAAQ